MRILLFIIALLVAGCGPVYVKEGVSAEERQRDFKECELEAAKTNGYDYIDAILRRGEVKRMCIELKGYTKQPYRKSEQP